MAAIVDNKGTITTREEDSKTLADIQKTKQWYIDNAYILGRTGDTGSNFYTSIVNQLDMLYKDIDAGKLGNDAKTGSWYTHIKSVKDNNPKS
jgi:hypothetical protein|tara:strand:- start:814 stop:1089 length:276 start_codon:yes stop_codon:yes gene_type:complete